MIYVYLTLMTSLYSVKHFRIVLTITGKCLDGCVNMELSLTPKKCRLSKREVNYLEQIVTAAGYRLGDSNAEEFRTLMHVSLAQLVK